MNKSSIFLIGFMGAGKTAVGKPLSLLTHQPFYDADRVIETEMGLSIPDLFHTYGEHWFRGKESETIDRLTQLSSIVLATGGGAILNPDNRLHLKTFGHVVYLRARLDTLWERIKNTADSRPLLQDKNVYQKMQTLLNERTTLYEETADSIVDTDDCTLDEIAMTVFEIVGAQ